jgi:Flp pilus assembly protein CpaB
VVLAIAIILAGLAALAVWQVLTNAEDAAKEGLKETAVYRTTVLVPEGTEGIVANANEWFVLSVENEKYVPANAITNEADLEAFVLTNRVAAGPISANQVLTSDQWTPVTEDVRPLADVIANGKQAMTIAAPGNQGLNQMARPGDRVNMIVTGEVELIGFTPVDGLGLGEVTPTDVTDTAVPGGQGVDTDGDGIPDIVIPQASKTLSRYVLQGLTVLAVGRELVPDEDSELVVTVPDAVPVEGEAVPVEDDTRTMLTLEVTPDQAERIAFAYGFGQIWLTLSPTDNFAAAETEGVVIENLFSDFGVLTTLFPQLVEFEKLLGGQ